MQEASIKRNAVAYALQAKGVQNPTHGVYTNAIESTNAKYEQIKQEGTKSMPEAAFTVYNLHRQAIREVVRAYHGTGNWQLSPDFRRFARPSTELPAFTAQTEEELLDSLRTARGFKNLEDINQDLEADPAEVECEEILRQCEWYRENKRERIIYDHDVAGWKVAGYMKSMQEQSFITKRQECSCNRGCPCAHWVIAMECSGFQISKDLLKKDVKQRLADENKKTKGTKRKLNRGRKGYVPDGTNPAIPTVTKKPRPPFSDPSYLRSRSTATETTSAHPVPDVPDAQPTLLDTIGMMAERERQRAFEGTQDLPGDATTIDGNDAPLISVTNTDLEAILADGAVIFDPEDVPSAVGIENMDTATSADITSAVCHDNPPVTTDMTNTGQADLPVSKTLSSGSSSLGITPSVVAELDKHLQQDPIYHDLVNGFHVDMYTPESLKTCHLESFECRYLFETNEKVGFIKADKNLNGSLLYSDTASAEALANMKFISAKLLSSGSKYLLSSRTHVVNIQEKKLSKSNFEDQSNREKESFGRILRGPMTAVKLQCVCKHPDITAVNNNFDVVCSKGGEKFHSQCINKEATTIDYDCAPCNITEIHKGAVWCERNNSKNYIHNTCPLDGAVTAVTQHVIAYNQQLTNSFPNDEAHKSLKIAIDHLQKNDSYSYQKTMLEYYKTQKEPKINTPEYKAWEKEHKRIVKKNAPILRYNEGKEDSKKKPLHNLPLTPSNIPYLGIPVEENNLFGDHQKLWSETFEKGCTFKTEVHCDKCGYNESMVQSSINMHQINPDDSVSLFMAKSVNAGYQNTCHVGNCGGTISIEPIEAVDRPWMITWDLSSMPLDRVNSVLHDIKNGDLPKTLQISGSTYQLSHVLLNERNLHYTSVHYDPKSNSWAFYDGKKDFVKTNSK